MCSDWPRQHVSGWWYTYPSEKYESVGMIIPNIWKNIFIKNKSKPPISYD
jgi:hypothetical protein